MVGWCGITVAILALCSAAEGYTPPGCNITSCMTPQVNNVTATRDPTNPVGIDQYDPAVRAPSANNTPWQIHLLPGSSDMQYMTLVWATGQYIGAPNDDGGPCNSVTFQQTTPSNATCNGAAPDKPNDPSRVGSKVYWSTSSSMADASNSNGYAQVYSQPQGTLDEALSDLINTNVDLDGSQNGTADGASYYSPVFHTATFGPLQAGVTYFYQVGDGNQSLSNSSAYSSVMNFTHVRPHGNASDYPFRFGIVADLGQTIYSNQTLTGLGNDQGQAVVLIGDLAYADDYNGHNTGQRNGYQPRWDTWGQLTQPLLSRVPFFSVMGNHEEESEFRYGDDYLATFDCESNAASPAPIGTPQCGLSWRTRYPLPLLANGSRPLYHSVDIGPSHWLMLNSYVASNNGSAQYSFVQQDLANYARSNRNGTDGPTPWLIVAMHEPWYSSTSPSNQDITGIFTLPENLLSHLDTGFFPQSPRTGYLGYLMYTQLESLFYEYGVDIVFTGHEHNYERTYPVFKDQPDNCGPLTIVIGDGGNEEGVQNNFIQPQPSWSAFRDLAFGQAGFVIQNTTFATWTWSADDGTPLDQANFTRAVGCANHFAAPYLGPPASSTVPVSAPQPAPAPSGLNQAAANRTASGFSPSPSPSPSPGSSPSPGIVSDITNGLSNVFG